MSRVLLFDIDGTLIKSGGVGGLALNRTFKELFGWDNALGGMHLDGMTDPLIYEAVFEAQGRPLEPFEPIYARYTEVLEECFQGFEKGRVLTGIPEILEALKGEDVALGLLTGNIEAGARLKLQHFGLWDHFDFGAYGSDHKIRAELVPIGVKRSKVTSCDRVVVIGDTPADIASAKAHDALSIAVATGSKYQYEDLKACEPDFLFRDFSNPAEVLKALLES